MKSVKCIPDIKNTDEYHEFVQILQKRTSYPPIRKTKYGVFIVLELSNGQERKMRLGIGYNKENDNSNLSCWRFDEKDNLERATLGDERYNVLNREAVIVGCVYYHRNQNNSRNFFLTAFPFDLEIAREILQYENVLPALYVPLSVNTVKADNNDPPNTYLNHYTVTETTNNINEFGSGVGLTKTISSETRPAIPVDTSTNPGSLQYPEYRNTKLQIRPVPVDEYQVFQIKAVGNQNNILVVTKINEETLFNPPIPVVTGE